jgi:hypothetical protein
MNKTTIAKIAALAFVAFSASPTMAANNNSPPAGAILDLAGGETGTPAQIVNHGAAVAESVNFISGVASTNITFAFREDPAFISFSNVVLIDLTTGSPTNLILNGNFASGSGNNATNWTFANIFGAAASGVVSSTCGGGLATCWFDGSVQAYDAITQVVATTIGDLYRLSFVYSDNGPLNIFQDLSTNGNTTGTGGNGIDILAYAQAGLPVACAPGTICTTTPVPEPESLALVGLGLAALGLSRRRKA